jgi:DNA polymerase III subunit beta
MVTRMKLSMERSALLRAMSRAQSVVERRNTIPILANVLIEAEGEQVSFRATDLDIEVIDRANAMVSRAGATTVPAHTLHEIARKLPDGAMVELHDDGLAGRLEVRAGRSHFSLATLPREDFPMMASAEYHTNFACPAPVLRRHWVRISLMGTFGFTAFNGLYYLAAHYTSAMNISAWGGIMSMGGLPSSNRIASLPTSAIISRSSLAATIIACSSSVCICGLQS